MREADFVPKWHVYVAVRKLGAGGDPKLTPFRLRDKLAADARTPSRRA
jgi:hypothetical protein